MILSGANSSALVQEAEFRWTASMFVKPNASLSLTVNCRLKKLSVTAVRNLPR